MSSLAPSAFLASAAGTCDLQSKLLLNCQVTSDSASERVLAHWRDIYDQSGDLVPSGDVACKQRAWDRPGVLADVLKLNVSLPDRRDHARLLVINYRCS